MIFWVKFAGEVSSVWNCHAVVYTKRSSSGDGCSWLATSFVFWLESICAPQIGRSSIYVFPTSFPCSMKERPAHNQLILLLFVCLIQFRIIKFYYYHLKDVLLI